MANITISIYTEYALATTPSTTAATTTAMPAIVSAFFQLIIWMGITIVPVGAVCSLTSDLLIISVMPCTKDISKRARIAYTSIAISDMVPVIVNYLLRALQLSSAILGGSYWIFERYNSATCKAGRYLEFTFQGMSNTLVAAFNVERCIAVASPFMARKFTFRFSVTMIVCIVLSMLAIHGGQLYINDLKGTAYGLTPYCGVQPVDNSGALMTLTMMINDVCPLLVMVLSNCAIFIILQRRDRLIQDINKKKSSIASAKIMVLISLVHVTFFLPGGLLYAASTTVPLGTTATTLRYASNISIYLGSYTSTTNFIVYLMNIRAFRQRFLYRQS